MSNDNEGKLEKLVSRKVMEEEVGSSVVANWYTSAKVYAGRLLVKEPDKWIEQYVQNRYKSWRDNGPN